VAAAVVLVFVAGNCVQGNGWAAARPPGSELIRAYSYESGNSGYGFTDRVFSYNGTFDEVLTSYRAYVQEKGGKQSQSWANSWRFDVGGDCTYVTPWSQDGNNATVRYRFSASELAKLDQSPGSFIEATPGDCQYRG
jgi:hypothetical protein